MIKTKSKNKNKKELKIALAQILEVAKFNKDFANTDYERERWETIIHKCYIALDKPNMLQLDKFLKKEKE